MKYGVSLSIKACRQFDIDLFEVQKAAIDIGFRRFRLMSYWNEIENTKDVYKWHELDEQIKLAAENGCEISLCLGLRQPRWPECHVPVWAKKLPKPERNKALLAYIKSVVQRYKRDKSIVSWQLENEALNRGFGDCPDYDRARLRREFNLVKKLDPGRPAVMSASNSFGLPMRQPLPDVVGFSQYFHQAKSNGISYRRLPRRFIKTRKLIIEKIMRRPVFCHELQMEPWGLSGIEHMSKAAKDHLMNPLVAARHIAFARQIGFKTIDLWGLEWWYFEKLHNNPKMWQFIAGLEKIYKL